MKRILAIALLGLVPFCARAADESGATKPNPIRVAIYTGPGVGGPGPEDLKATLSQDPGKFTSSFIGPEDVRAGKLDQFDLVVFPGGSGSRQAEGLGSDGCETVRKFVERGGGYVGICAGCYLACENFSWSLKILDAKTKSSKWKRGRKALELGVADGAAPLLGVGDETIVVKYANGPVMEPAGSPDLPDYTALATFKTETAENETPAGIQIGTPAILTSAFGKGRVVGISPHPEQTEGFKGIVPRLIEWAVSGTDQTGSGQ